MHLKTKQVTYLTLLAFYLCVLCHPSTSSDSSPAKALIKTAAKKKASKMIQQKFYDSVNANIISAAMLSSAGAFNKYSASSHSSSMYHRQNHRTSLLSPAHTATSSFFRPAMRAAFKEVVAYLAAPFFMPIAVGRAMMQPPGLPSQDKLMRRFARYLVREVVLGDKTQELDNHFKDKFLEYLTKDRKNILLSMKQFRDLQKTQVNKKPALTSSSPSSSSTENKSDVSLEAANSSNNQIVS